MKTKLSALLDDAAEADELDHLCDALGKADDLRDCGRIYPLIGDVLRGESLLGTDITAAVMRRIQHEPQVVAFRRRPRWLSPMMAMAAGISGIAVVVWLALPLARQGAAPVQQTAQSQPAPAAVAKSDSAMPDKLAPERDMQEYLIAHQSQAGGLQFQGGSEHVRTVSYDTGK